VSEKPRWYLEFKKCVNELKKKSNNQWYKSLQDNLEVLRETGSGNCVAWSLLMKEIALKFNLTIYLIILNSPKSIERHQVSVVVEKDGSTYLQSCLSLTKQKVRIVEPIKKKELLEKLTECSRSAEWQSDTIVIDRLERFRKGRKALLVRD
jgi:hypothetical protein